MRRPADVRVVTCPLTARERDALDELKARLAITSDANAMRTALYSLCAHAEVNIDTSLFRVRGGHRQKRVTWNRTQKVSA